VKNKKLKKRKSKKIKNLLEISLLLVLLVSIVYAIYNLGPSMTGFLTGQVKEVNKVNLKVTSNSTYIITLKRQGNLMSLRLDGSVTNYGKAKAYLENNGIKKLIFDSERLNKSRIRQSNQSNLITGFSIESNLEKKSNNTTNSRPIWVGLNEFTIEKTTLIDLSKQFIDEDNDKLIFNHSPNESLDIVLGKDLISITPKPGINKNIKLTLSAFDGHNITIKDINLIVKSESISEETENNINNNNKSMINETINNNTINKEIIGNATIINQTIINNTLANQTSLNESINETTKNETFKNTIMLKFDYNKDSIYDSNNDGKETINGVVDLSVKNTEFSWEVDKSKLCARYEIYDLEEEALTYFCNGNSNCCSFFELLPMDTSWDSIYYSTYGKDGAGHNNKISAQIIYYDVNLSFENPKAEIYHSKWSNLSVIFSEDEIIFFDECIDTCQLSFSNKTNYTLIFEIELGAVLTIDRINYDVFVRHVNHPPELIKNISTINAYDYLNYTINLSDHFFDPDGDKLTYNYDISGNMTFVFNENIATLIPKKGDFGADYAYLSAKDENDLVASNIFKINITKSSFHSLGDSLNNSFIIQNAVGKSLAIINSVGSMKIFGNLTENTEPTAGINDFVIQNSSGGLNAVITNPEGNLIIKGSISKNNKLLIPTQNSFIIQNKSEEVVAYINNTGFLFLAGSLIEGIVFD
jgi:hypothetical protein